MIISKAVSSAWRAYTASFAATGKYLLTEACLLLICLAPLLFLSSAALAPFALAAVVLWILIRIPARMNAAIGMRNSLQGGSLYGPDLISAANYREKLIFGLKRLLFLMLWSVPLIALAIVVKIHFSGDVDSFTVLRMIKNELGGGDQMRGILVLLLISLASLLLLVIGCAFHSGARHAFAQGDPSLVRGHHGKVMLAWLVSLVSILPLVIAVVVVVFRYLPAVSNLTGLLTGKVNLPSTKGTLLILASGAVLTVPLLPLRSLISAAFVDGLQKKA